MANAHQQEKESFLIPE